MLPLLLTLLPLAPSSEAANVLPVVQGAASPPAAAPAAQDPAPAVDPARQFDFWVGEWQVQNRHLQPDGTWQAGTAARARITPVLDGAAILEQWAGPFGNSFMNGFSLRSYDPSTQLWSIILFWTMDGNSGFGRMQGSFRHGRGEFLSPLKPTPGQGDVTRYTFSDGLPQTVRWDQAQSQDGGLSWRTDWIMEFTRTAPASKCTEARLFTAPWNAGTLSPHVEARQLDWLRGRWTGSETRAGFKGTWETRFECTLMDKDCLVTTAFASRLHGDLDWQKTLQVRGFVSGNQRWEAWGASESDPVLRPSIGAETENGMEFLGTDADGNEVRESFERLGPDHLRWQVTIRSNGVEDWEIQSIRDLKRDA